MEDIRKGAFQPIIDYDGKMPMDFAFLPMTHYSDYTTRQWPTASQPAGHLLLRPEPPHPDPAEKRGSAANRHTALERNCKKYDLQDRQLKDTEKREKYRIYGELINTYGYSLPEGAKELTALNYYDGKEITIPLDPARTPQENAQRYFSRYNKLKRTYEALSQLTR